MRLLVALLASLLISEPAHAAFLAPLIPLVVGAAGASAWVVAAVSVATSIASTFLQKALVKKPRPPGIQTERTATGGANSRALIFGLYATAGSEAAPPMSHGKVDKTPNAYFTKIIALADAPIDGLSRLIINGEYVGWNDGVTEEYGYPLTGKYSGIGWLRFYDGTQTTADAMLVDKYAVYPYRSWTAARVGDNVAYAILTFKYDPEIYKSEPDCRFELRGMHLLDPRDGLTKYTVNAIVMVYNILRGITLADGMIYGGSCTADELPLSNWSAAMNVCDEAIALSGGGTEPRYRAGLEIKIAEMQPAEAIEELLKAASAEIVELGGVYKVRAGPPSLPVMFITDDDIIVSKEQDFDPFPGIGAAVNTVHAVFPHPDEQWSLHDAPPFSDPAYVAADDATPFTGNLELPACPYPNQVQRNMRAWLQDDRRWRQHHFAFGPYGFALEPLDVVSWSSDRNGYIDKLFEITTSIPDLMTLNNEVHLREVDPTDYDWSSGFELPDPVTSGEWDLPTAQAVPGFSAVAWTIRDDLNDARRPAIRCTWTADAAEDAQLLKIQIRNFITLETVQDVTVTNVSDGERIISEGILPETAYQVRARYIVDRSTDWSDWISVTTGAVKLNEKDFDFDAVVEALGESQLLSGFNKPFNDVNIRQIFDIVHNDTLALDHKQTEIKAVAKANASIALITEETTARVTADSALAEQIDTVAATANDAAAAVVTETTARVDGDTALASQITTVTARLDGAGGPGVTVEQAITAQGNSIATLNASYTVRVNVNGRVTGFGLAAGVDNTEFAILADRFIVVDPSNNSVLGYPFQVVGGAVYIRKAFIQKITADDIDANTITADRIAVRTLTADRIAVAGVTATELASSAGGVSGGYYNVTFTAFTSTSTWHEIAIVTLTPEHGRTLKGMTAAFFRKTTSGTSRIEIEIVRDDGTLIYGPVLIQVADEGTAVNIPFLDAVTAGRATTWRMFARKYSNSDEVTASYRYFYIEELSRVQAQSVQIDSGSATDGPGRGTAGVGSSTAGWNYTDLP